MPLGVLQEGWPHYDGLDSSPWVPTYKAPHSSHIKTCFGESQITTCQEGFRCVSRVRRFGLNHTHEVLVGQARDAQMSSGDAKVGENGKPVQNEPEVEEYEWNCPVQDRWVADRFESGVEADQCREERDCVCIARGAEDSFTELKDGLEKRHETVEAEVGCGGGKSQKIPLIVIPHYQQRKLSDHFDPMNVNSDLGEVVQQPSAEWVSTYKHTAPRMQIALDSLKTWISDTFDQKVLDKQFVCGPPIPDKEATMSPDDVHEASVKIRNFQVLQKDCENMRDTVPLLISPKNEKVSPPGQEFISDKKLNCYKLKDGDACVQLNCYSGHEDTTFKDHLREFEARMMSCEPEPEDINTTKAEEAEAAAPAASAVSTTQHSMGFGSAAVAVLLGRSGVHGVPTSVSSKRSSWMRFL